MDLEFDIAEAAKRYVGRVVTIQGWGHQKFVGTVANVNHEVVLLTNAVAYDQYDGGHWQEKQMRDNLEDGIEVGSERDNDPAFFHLLN